MFNFYDSLYPEDLSAVWADLPAEDITALTINIGKRVITPQKQFETFFDGRRLKADDTDKAEILFFTVYDKNKWLIEKIKKEGEIIKGLLDLDNWADVTTSDNTNTAETESTTKSEGQNVGSSGNTDNNSYVEESELNGFMSFDNRKVIPANVLTQNNTKDVRDDSVKSLNNIKSLSTVRNSNNSADFIGFHALKLKGLKTEFWGKFNILFI